MAVMERERWTDERIDERFNGVDADIRELRVEIKEGFQRIDKRFDQIEKRFERVDDKFNTMQTEMNMRFEAVRRNMTYWFLGFFSSVVASLIAVGFA
jgi:archaellum component FlaC